MVTCVLFCAWMICWKINICGFFIFKWKVPLFLAKFWLFRVMTKEIWGHWFNFSYFFQHIIQEQNLTHVNSVECPSALSTSWIPTFVWFMREKSILVNFVEENTIVQNLWKNINSKIMASTKRASTNMTMSSIFNLKFLALLSFQKCTSVINTSNILEQYLNNVWTILEQDLNGTWTIHTKILTWKILLIWLVLKLAALKATFYDTPQVSFESEEYENEN